MKTEIIRKNEVQVKSKVRDVTFFMTDIWKKGQVWKLRLVMTP